MSHMIFLLICIIWGTSFILMARAAEVFSSLGVAFWRVFLGGLVILLIALVRKEKLTVAKKHWLPLFFVGGMGYALPYVLQPYVIAKGMEHGVMGTLVVFVPLITIVFSIPLLKTRPTARQLLGVVGGFIFCILLSIDSIHRGLPVLLTLLAILAPCSYAFTNTYVKRSLKDVSVYPLTIWTLLICSAVLVVLALATDPAGLVGMGMAKTVTQQKSVSWNFAALSLVLLGVLATGIAMLLFNQLIITRGPLFAGMVTYVIPIGAVFVSFLDGERVTGMQLIAMAGTLGMVALVQYRAKDVPLEAVPKKQVADSDEIAHDSVVLPIGKCGK